MATRKKTASKKKATSKKAMVKQSNKDLAVMSSFEEDADSGFEDMSQDDMVMPFLRCLQKTSPQCDEDESNYIEGAKPGQFYNTATQEVLDGPLTLVPCIYQRQFLEWKPRDEGGGLVGLRDEAYCMEHCDRDEGGRYITEEGNHVMDTRNHFCLLIDEEGNFNSVVISLTSTQIKKSKQWNTIARQIKLEKGDGSGVFTPPLCSHQYSMSSVAESNDKGSWKGVKFELEGMVQDEMVYAAARELASIVKAGEAKVDYSQSVESAAPSVEDGDGEEAEFE